MVMAIHEFSGLHFCDLQDRDFETLKWVNVNNLKIENEESINE